MKIDYKIVKNKYKEEVDGADGKIRRLDRIEYLVNDGAELIAVFQKRPEADRFVELVKEQHKARK